METAPSDSVTPLILVIEDSDIIRKTFVMQIQKMGRYRVEEAEDLATARAFLDTHPEDLSLILLDLMLPDGDGRAILDECRADSQLADVPVIIITATTEAETMEDCLRRGAVDYLQKPCPRYELELRINGAVERYQALLRLKCLTDELRQKEYLLNESQRIARVGGWYWNPSTGKAVWTRELFKILGMNPDTDTPDPAAVIERYLDDGRERVQNAVETSIRTHEPFDITARVRTSDDRIIWTRARGYANRDDDQQYALWGILQDITEIRDAEEELRQSEERYAFAMEATSDGIWDWDMIGGTVHFSTNWGRMFGYRPEEVRDHFDTWNGMLHPEDKDRIFASIQKHLDHGTPYEVEYRMQCKDGAWKWVLTRGQVVARDASGTPTRMVGTNIDINPRKRLEEERDRLFTSSIDMLCVAGFDGTLHQVNPAWEKTLGWTTEELLSRPFMELIHEADRAATIKTMGQLFENETVLGFENRFLHKDGSYRWFSWNSFPKVDEKLIYAVARDMTENRKLRDQLRHAALHDPLTDLFNRRALFDELKRELSSAKRYGTPLCFCLADLDHFKSVNDTHGHQMGDEVLRRFAEVLKESLRDTDIVGRYGGEEFGIILPNTGLEAAAACLERAREAWRDVAFPAPGGGIFTVTATFGVAQLQSTDESTDMLMERADQTLYAGKEAGRDRVCTAADNPIP